MSAEKTVEGYLRELPPERREVISAVRNAVRKSMPDGYREVMDYGMICWVVPFSRYPITYNRKPLCFVSLAAQKNYNALYLMGVYGDPKIAKRFTEGFAEAGKKLDMGKSCVRFRDVSDLPLDVIGESIAAVPVDDYIAIYERSHPAVRKPSAASLAAAKARAEERAASDASAKAASDAAARRKAAKKPPVAKTKWSAASGGRTGGSSADAGSSRAKSAPRERQKSSGNGATSKGARGASGGRPATTSRSASPQQARSAKPSRQHASPSSAKRGSARRNAR